MDTSSGISIVKRTLSSVLLDPGGTKKEKIRSVIHSYVIQASKHVNKASHIFNLYLLYRNRDFFDHDFDTKFSSCFDVQFIERLMNLGLGPSTSENPLVQKIWEQYFSGFPIDTKIPICNQVFKYLASKYLTNFKNSLWMNFFSRQKKYLLCWLKKNDHPEEDFKLLEKKINNAPTKKELTHHNYDAFIKLNRNLLGVKDGVIIDKAWTKNNDNYPIIIKYYYHILKEIENDPNIKKFTLAPITKIARQHITIDTTVLYHILNTFNLKDLIGLKSVNSGKEVFRKEFINPVNRGYWFKLFDKAAVAPGFQGNIPGEVNEKENKSKKRQIIMKNPQSTKKVSSALKRKKFAYLLDTDGYSVSLHYDSDLVKRNSKGRILKRKQEIVAPKEISLENKRIIGIDPGRVKPLVGVERIPPEKQTPTEKHPNKKIIKKYSITRREFYRAAGKRKRCQLAKKWMKEIEDAETQYQKYSIKTTSLNTYYKFLGTYFKVYDKLWEAKTNIKWSQGKFRVYTLTQKFLDKKVQEMINFDPSKKIVLAYGDAKFSPNGKGELSAPKTSILKKLSKKFEVQMIDEYKTSQCCCHCGSQLEDIKETKEDLINKKRKQEKKEKVKRKKLEKRLRKFKKEQETLELECEKNPEPTNEEKKSRKEKERNLSKRIEKVKRTMEKDEEEKEKEKEREEKGKSKKGKKEWSLRGLKQCKSIECSKAGRIKVNRDLNAAINMLRCLEGERPECLRRVHNEDVMEEDKETTLPEKLNIEGWSSNGAKEEIAS